MATVQQTLAIAGAAEGSWFTVNGVSTDVRYVASFANANSGMSFGVFQFDVATNTTGQALFRDVLSRAVDAKSIDAATSRHLYAVASRRNAKSHFSLDDRRAANELLGDVTAKGLIDFADRQRAITVGGNIDGLIAGAAIFWTTKMLASPILTPGGRDNLRLFAYLLATLNRYPADQAVCEDWLVGKVVHTKGGPPTGLQLKAPPTVADMHAFLHSLRIWDGTQGSYQFLSDRLDPTVARIGG